MNGPSLPADTLRTAVLKLLAEEVKTAADAGKGGLKDAMDELGIESLGARLADGTKVATVRRAGGDTSPKVTDPARFLAWVRENRPDEIVPTVRESYQKALLAEIAQTGEIVPGVEFRTGTEYLTVSYANGSVQGRERIKQAWRDGQISLPELLALPAGGEPDAA